MPEMRFDVRWPSGETTRCYSPSLVVSELLEQREYPLFEFLERVRAGLNIGGERVRLKFGFYCSAASDQLLQLEQLAASYESEAKVAVTGLYPPGVEMPPLAESETGLESVGGA